MDIKSKKSRKVSFYASYIIAGLSGVATIFCVNALLVLYDTCGYGENGEFLEILNNNIATLWVWASIAAVTFVITFISAIVTVGEKDEAGDININVFDKIYFEIQVLIEIVLVAFGVLISEMFYTYIAKTYLFTEAVSKLKGFAIDDQYYYGNWNNFAPKWVEITLAFAGAGVVIFLGIAIILSILKKIKAKCFWKHSICGGLVIYLYESFMKNENSFWKLLILLVIGCLLSATVVCAPLVLIAIFIFLPRWGKKFDQIKEGIDQVKSGNLSYKIPIVGDSDLDKLAMGINEISEASSTAVQNELKNQRMKTELISNVSHDLKTPLTSMITYIDLLKTQGLSNEHAGEYLQIIDEKTQRLRKLTEDLFEAAKASSGAIPVRIERLEMLSLVNQACGEMEDKLETKDLQVIINSDVERVYVDADGQLLWRVLDNLLVNVDKYALEGSRIYVDLNIRGDNLISLELKNVSREPLNISSEELMERFKRGDESRNTEGSGLGLAIAKDLIKLMGGWFEIEIDGDLFKATVTLNKSKDQNPPNIASDAKAAKEPETKGNNLEDVNSDKTEENNPKDLKVDNNKKKLK